jgi:hypothetical protein
MGQTAIASVLCVVAAVSVALFRLVDQWIGTAVGVAGIVGVVILSLAAAEMKQSDDNDPRGTDET